MASSYESLLNLDAKLVRAGHHPIPDRWKVEFEKFYAHPTAKRLVAQCGRGSAKSNVAAKCALNEVLNNDWRHVPPGEVHYAAFVSASKDEANQRLTLLQSFLTALKIDYEASGDTIHLQGMRVGFRVFAQSVAAVSGFRCIFFVADECAKWRSDRTAKNPAQEVVTSLQSMCITHPNARSLLLSSPWGTQSYHYKCILQGDDSRQICMQAASWVCNPDGITERAARAASDSEAHFRREYLAIASATLEDGFFEESVIMRAVDAGRSHIGIPASGSRYFAAVDPAFAGGKGDLFGVGLVTSEQGKLDPLYGTRSQRVTTVQECHEWRPTGEATPMIHKLKQDVLNRYEINKVYSDRFEGYSFRDLARTHGITVEVVTGDSEDNSTIARYKSVRTAMMDGCFRIPEYEPLITALRAVASELSASGNELIRLPKLESGSHCDIVSAVVLAGSLALAKPAHLPEHRMSNWEQNERAANQRRFIASFCGGL